MKLCIYGTGAIGGHLAARLMKTGTHEVSVIARNQQLQAIERDGLTLQSGEESLTVRPRQVTDRPETLPPQDVVFVTLKAPAQAAAASAIAGLLAPGGRAVFVCNGIPWWWRYHGPAEPGSPLPLLDPGAALWKTIRPERAIGCVVYSGNEVIRPGMIHHTAGNRWLLGDPAPGISPETREITEVMRQAGLRTDCVDDIRAEVWQKLLRNAPLNTMCALTRLPVDGLARDPQLWALYDAVVDEVVAIAAACGTDLSASVRSARLKAIPSGSPPTIPEIRPSMLQDVLAGRPMEVAAILEQVQAFGRETGTASPRLDVLTALLAGLDRANDSLSGNQA